jgi:cell wall-associated NlpC family hydrolase
MAATFDGGGYWLAYQDGTVAGFGDAPSMNLTAPSGLSPIVAIAGADRLVPSDYVNWTQQAAGACPGLSWTVLAAIAKVESDFGRSTLPGVTSASNPAGAQGPMQFLPATFAAYSQPTPAGGRNPASPYDPVDSIWAAARLLCADGAGQPATLSQAIFAYNHATWYVNQVEALAASYQLYSPASLAASGRDGAALNIARTQMGVPYIWGGETPGVGFDCSGLVQWAYSAAGIVLPRTSQDQWAALPHLPAGATMQPGDLVFFAGSDGTMTAPGHVGIYIGNGQMLDAPYTGTDIRIDTIDWTDYVGAARPAGPGQ